MARRTKRGFTLIELLLVIGIIAILASIVIVALNPTKQLGDARNAQRRSDVNAILNALYQWSIDHNGTFPITFQTSDTGLAEVCAEAGACPGFTDIDFLTGSYITNIPKDPQEATTSSGSEYRVWRTATLRFTVKANRTENAATISVTR